MRSAFALFNWAMIANFHTFSIKHMECYLSGFQARFNARKEGDRLVPRFRAALDIDPTPCSVLAEGIVGTFPFAFPSVFVVLSDARGF